MIFKHKTPHSFRDTGSVITIHHLTGLMVPWLKGYEDFIKMLWEGAQSLHSPEGTLSAVSGRSSKIIAVSTRQVNENESMVVLQEQSV